MTTRTRAKLLVAKDRGELRRLAAEVIARKIHAAVQARGLCTMALSGGSTPGPVYEELGESDLAAKIPWSQIEIYFADERNVPLDHPESNYRLVKETLLKSHPESLGRMFRMPADAADRALAARRYARRLPDPLDLLVLGMGADGHTASLFPGSPALVVHDRAVVAASGRVSLTDAALNRSAQVLFLVAGAQKAAALAAVLEGPPAAQQFPAQLIRPESGAITWLVDVAAASRLQKTRV